MIIHFMYRGQEVLVVDEGSGEVTPPRVGDWITIRHREDGDPRRAKVRSVEWLYQCYKMSGTEVIIQNNRHVNIYLQPLLTPAEIGNMHYPDWSYREYDSLKTDEE